MSTPEQFDPSAHNLDDVRAYLDDASPEEVERVLAAERAGKARVGILSAYDGEPGQGDGGVSTAPIEPSPDAGTTRTTDDTTIPSEVAPGDAPADTLDPSEHVTSTPTYPGDQAKAEGTVNAVTLLPNPPSGTGTAAGEPAEPRFEEYDAYRPDNTKVRVRRNMETGASEIISG